MLSATFGTTARSTAGRTAWACPASSTWSRRRRRDRQRHRHQQRVSGTAPPGGGPPTGPGNPAPPLPLLTVTLKVSDATPLAGKRVRVFGVVRPARDGRKVQIQKRLRNGSFKTIATTRLRDAGAAKSTYSLLLRLSADAVLRAREAGDDEAATGLSHRRKLDVHSPA